MGYSNRELVIFGASAVAILASIISIIQGVSETGFYLSVFVILMFLIVIVMTAKK
ncbi:hypothetical protein J2128_002302 [Methanomicrobium sp. W14]|uniref:hypothetical protein n=1 Tax=Methanomicrobium sp. W14 TaxID=2817839 RepID=UPI001AE7990E|nr:hypothetical protein [Methanomicrobium sp. W14]MBP2134336.1 hypothetical protein [Methanomicrobium sp. W14]